VPLFAIVNTAIIINMKTGIFDTKLFAGIFLGLFIGKPLGITLFSYMATKLKLAILPSNANFKSLFLVSILGGIGFTMSIFISLLAFTDVILIEQSKLYVLLGSAAAIIVGAFALNKFVSSKF
jgi:NhaA family Na+:H+ antiporter